MARFQCRSIHAKVFSIKEKEMNKQIAIFSHETGSKTTPIMENQAFAGAIFHVTVHKTPPAGSDGSLSVSMAAKMLDASPTRVPLAIWNAMFPTGETGTKTLVIYPGTAEYPHQLGQVVFYPMVLPALFDFRVSLIGEGWEYSVEASLQG